MTKVYTVTTTVMAGSTPVIVYMGGIDDIVWTHHSCGQNIRIYGDLVEKLQAKGYSDLWEHTANAAPIVHNDANTADYPRVPDDNTDIDNWPTMFGQTPGENWLGDMLEHEVIMLKACFTILPFTTDEEVTAAETDTESVWTAADAHTDKLWVVMTVPPLLEANCTAAEAQRTRNLANWMMANIDKSRDNVRCFDLFDVMADTDNWMRDGWGETDSDPHPNATVCPQIAQALADWLDIAIKDWRAV